VVFQTTDFSHETVDITPPWGSVWSRSGQRRSGPVAAHNAV